jgi:hypothetical protein
MSTIWKNHHNSISEDKPLNTRQVLAAVDLEIDSVVAQHAERRRREERRRPPLNAAPVIDNNFLT